MIRRGFAALTLLLFVGVLVAQQYTLTGGLTGPLADWFAAKNGAYPWGDTNICVETSGTHANGSLATPATYNLGDGVGSRTLTGEVTCTQDDGKAPDGSSLTFGVYGLTNLDMGTPANSTIRQINKMTGFGAFDSAGNSPAGWYGMCTTGIMSATACDWKANKMISVNGWLVAPIHRQDHTGYWSHDLSLIASPDGGAHWCNPYNFFAGGTTPSGCIAAANSANGDVPKCDAPSVQTTLSSPLSSGAATMLVASGAGIVNGMYVGLQPEASNVLEFVRVTAGGGTNTLTIQRLGGSGHSSGATVQIPAACTDAAYTDATHSSMMFKDTAPYDGTTGWAHNVYFFDYCAGNSCTGMPDGADTYIYGWAPNGNESRYYLFRIPKDITKIMDPSKWEWYNYGSYSPWNVGDGTDAANWTATAPGVQVFAGRAYSSSITGTNLGQNQVNFKGVVYAPILLCASAGNCTYVASVYQPSATGSSGIVAEGTMSFAHPWGPYSSLQSVVNNYPSSPATTAGPYGFFAINRMYAKTLSTTPFAVRTIVTANTGNYQAVGTLVWQAYDLVIAPPSTGNGQHGKSKLRFSTGAGSGTLPRRGLYAYFDCYDNNFYGVGGSLYPPYLYCADIASSPPKLVLSSLDGSGNVKNSTNSGIVWEATGPAMIKSAARRFELRTYDNANSVVAPAPFTGNVAWTTNMIVNIASLPGGGQGLWQIGNTAGHFMELEVNAGTGKLLMWIQGSTSGGYVTTTSSYGGVTAGAWHMITVTKEIGALSVGAGGTIHMYVDGIEAGLTLSQAMAGTPATTASTLQVMYAQQGPGGTSGKLGGFGLWTRALAAPEVYRMYQALKANTATRGIALP